MASCVFPLLLLPKIWVRLPALHPPPSNPSIAFEPVLWTGREETLLMMASAVSQLSVVISQVLRSQLAFITDVFLTVSRSPAKKFDVNPQPPPQTKRPLSVLQKATNKQVSVRLKNEIEYRGKMSNVDPYMNVILVDAEESENGAKVANYGKVVIRGNNVLYVKIEDRL
jgi:small nuclear ribonucleoprotein